MASNMNPRLQTQYLPAPAPFVGSHSRNASNTSLLSPTNPTSTSRGTLTRQRSLRSDRSRNEVPEITPHTISNGLSSFPRRQQQKSPQQWQSQSQDEETREPSSQRANAIWAEMQITIDEVELNAMSEQLFPPEHAKALDELRAAQIALAQAWARSEAEEDEQENIFMIGENDKILNNVNPIGSERREIPSIIPGRPRSITTKSTASESSHLEDETENDIRLARKRREANDLYFSKVNTGVLDVISKLEEVSKAMKGVELESKEIWEDGESIDTASAI